MPRTGVLLGVLTLSVLAACASGPDESVPVGSEVAATTSASPPSPVTDESVTDASVPDPGPSRPDVSDPDENEPDVSDPDENEPDESEPDGVTPEGYERVQATVTAADGTVCDVCLWLAESAEQRSQGLMFVTDLGPADGMAFVYPVPHSGNFWMKNTLLPLSIAFFDPAGTYLDAFDMEPCTDEPCDLYPTPDDFLVAIETRQGELAELGIGPGSVLELTDLPCD